MMRFTKTISMNRIELPVRLIDEMNPSLTRVCEARGGAGSPSQLRGQPPSSGAKEDAGVLVQPGTCAL